MAEKKILAVVQPQFVTSDTWTGERIGPERAKRAYPFESMRAAGIPLALSSDCPVESLDSFRCLHAAVNRHPWSAEEKLTVDDALSAYTVGSHYSLHQEHQLGRIAPGYLADFVVLSTDPIGMSLDAWEGLRVEATFVGGDCLYERE